MRQTTILGPRGCSARWALRLELPDRFVFQPARVLDVLVGQRQDDVRKAKSGCLYGVRSDAYTWREFAPCAVKRLPYIPPSLGAKKMPVRTSTPTAIRL